MKVKISGRQRRRLRIRKNVSGSADRPRLSVRRSLKNLFVQLVDDAKGATLLSVSTASSDLKKKFSYGGNVKAAAILGTEVAERAKEKKITKVVFDRGGCDYHGRIKAFAEAARKGGLEF